MKSIKKIFQPLLAALFLLLLAPQSRAQISLGADSIECPIVGFGVGLAAPWGALSTATAPDGSTTHEGTMASLYEPPYLDFGVMAAYKFASNWLLTLDGDMWFGLSSDNLTHRYERMGDIFAGQLMLGSGGYDGVVTLYNRGIMARVGAGHIFPVIKGNPNSGIVARASAGWLGQRTIFMQDRNESPVPQIEGDYRRLYDHYRNGVMLTEGLGFWFMSNRLNLVNLSVEFQISECYTWSSRSYQLDNYLGLNGKDRNTYFDLVYSVKFTWMFPLRGKTAYDYYF